MLQLQITPTDARYIYRCLDAALKQISTLTDVLDLRQYSTRHSSLTILNRCYELAQSAIRKLDRCTPFFPSNPVFHEVLDSSVSLVSSLHSYLLFPVRGKTKRVVLVASLTNLSKRVRNGITEILNSISSLLVKKDKPTPKTHVAPPTPPPPSSILVQFFSAAKDRGWKVQEPRFSFSIEEEEAEDPFFASCVLVKSLSQPYHTLLEEGVDLGVVSCNILLLDAYRLPATVISQCEDHHTLHKVFGTYVVLQNVPLIGVRRELLLRTFSDGKTKLDSSKFQKLLPRVKEEHPEICASIANTFPTGPARFARNHYYSPLLPNSLAESRNFNLGIWNFLVSRREEKSKKISTPSAESFSSPSIENG